MDPNRNRPKKITQNQEKKNGNKKEKGFKIYPIIPKHKWFKAYREARNFFCILWYKNYAAIPCLDEKCKKRITFDFFFSSQSLINTVKEGGATDWAILTCPYCNKLVGFRLEANMVNVKTMRIDWRIRQTPSMSKEEFKKQFSVIN